MAVRGLVFACKRPHLQVAVTVSPCAWSLVVPFVAKSIFSVCGAAPPPSEAIPLFNPKYFWSQLYVFIIYFSPTNLPFPPFGFLSSHDALPIVLCSLTLSPPSSLPLALSPLERRLFSLRPDERLWRTIKMLFKCKGVCARVRDISC